MNTAALLERADIWRGGSPSPRFRGGTVASGHPRLDAELGGWPLGCLTELLLPAAGVGEVSLLLPALARLAEDGRRLLWVAPPYLPYAPALRAAGIAPEALRVVRSADAAGCWWAMEQALKSGVCGAVLGWMRQASLRRLRRLQLAAEAGEALAVLLRPAACARQHSPAALRLALHPVAGGLEVEILKRRGGWGRRALRLVPGHAVAGA